MSKPAEDQPVTWVTTEMIQARKDEFEAQRIFYQTCADILEQEFVHQPPTFRRTRWYPRVPGNGRYPGCGLINYRSRTHIEVNLYAPGILRGVFDSPEATFEALKKLVDKPV